MTLDTLGTRGFSRVVRPKTRAPKKLPVRGKSGRKNLWRRAFWFTVLNGTDPVSNLSIKPAVSYGDHMHKDVNEMAVFTIAGVEGEEKGKNQRTKRVSARSFWPFPSLSTACQAGYVCNIRLLILSGWQRKWKISTYHFGITWASSATIPKYKRVAIILVGMIAR